MTVAQGPSGGIAQPIIRAGPGASGRRAPDPGNAGSGGAIAAGAVAGRTPRRARPSVGADLRNCASRRSRQSRPLTDQPAASLPPEPGASRAGVLDCLLEGRCKRFRRFVPAADRSRSAAACAGKAKPSPASRLRCFLHPPGLAAGMHPPRHRRAERIACRLRVRSRSANFRRRLRSRIASCAGSGIPISVSLPGRGTPAKRPASCRQVLPRSPGPLRTCDGAGTARRCPSLSIGRPGRGRSGQRLRRLPDGGAIPAGVAGMAHVPFRNLRHRPALLRGVEPGKGGACSSLARPPGTGIGSRNTHRPSAAGVRRSAACPRAPEGSADLPVPLFDGNPLEHRSGRTIPGAYFFRAMQNSSGKSRYLRNMEHG